MVIFDAYYDMYRNGMILNTGQGEYGERSQAFALLSPAQHA